MANKYVDVWKYPHMSYKKAFVIATGISVFAVGLAFFSFSNYIASHITGPMQVNFLTEQEADKVVEEVKEQIQEEQKQQEVVRENNANAAGGAGKGGQSGTSNTPTKSAITPSSQRATTGEVGTTKSSSVGDSTGDGLVGEVGKGLGNGEGNSNETGNGGAESSDGGGGSFSSDRYQANFESIITNNYPLQALQFQITGEVTLGITFGPDGSVEDVTVISSDDAILSEHAVQYARAAGRAENTTGQSRYETIVLHYRL